ncbi:MAG: SDR family NAD(P)-dependent oxidoreductase [Deltaproteobacteria bacterium]|nr:SDR family NAD(P)-dependent oxidoreductase [Deltaproteobacteria bacterium]
MRAQTVVTDSKAFIITGPTAGIGRATAFELAKHGTVVLVGRDRERLAEVQKRIERKGQRAVAVVCDLSDLASVKRAAAEVIALQLPIAGLLNNAGIMQTRPTQNARGWDLSFATNHLGPFALTEALAPHLPDGANVLFVGSAVEDPERKPAVAAGFRGARYLSAEASTRGEWRPGGSAKPGMDAYATSKQCSIVTALVLARELPRLHINAVEPGFTPGTSLGRDAPVIVRALSKVLIPVLVPLLMPFVKILSTPKRSAQVLTRILTDASGRTGIYFDERGEAMTGSVELRDTQFQDRVVAETRALLASAKI